MKAMDCASDSEEEISVGCPSPRSSQKGDDSDADSFEEEEEEEDEEEEELLKHDSGSAGVRSFSILDILNHRPKVAEPIKSREQPAVTSSLRAEPCVNLPAPARIIRPWDFPPFHATSAFLNPNLCLPFPQHNPFLPATLHPALPFHPFNVHAFTAPRASSASPYSGSSDVHDTDGDADDFSTAGSASGGSPATANRQKALKNGAKKSEAAGSTAAAANVANIATPKGSSAVNGTPLDALFQMTSKTFDGVSSSDPSGQSSFHRFKKIRIKFH